ncbi:hypothetical protein FG386_000855 [Cryptosporidium ryanae]|uniref:uncharacterized protein n=1 Tax=Cryptosporidium ryanae TaxID=515981 RepID=UPI00351A7CB3|nr:hypothetical protein FG386_000855 [Cryptosporidium ryanae]
MSFYSREIKCFVEVLVCSYFENEIKKLVDFGSLFNICIVKVIDTETYDNEFISRGKYAFYIPEEPHLKPTLEDKLWISSKNLVHCFDTSTSKFDITNACNDLLRIIIWYLSWNPSLEFPIYESNMINKSPFPICIISSSSIFGYLLGYPYFLKNIPVTILVFDRENEKTESAIKKEYLDSVRIIKFSDVSSTIEEIMSFTQELGFSSIIIGPSTKIPEDILLKIILGSISVNGTIISSHKIEQLSSFECSVLFQKKCSLMFSGLNMNPADWISKILNKQCSDLKKIDLFSTVKLENNLCENNTIKIGNELSYVLAKSF